MAHINYSLATLRSQSAAGLLLALFWVCLIAGAVSAISYAVERSTSDGKLLPSGTIVVASDNDTVRPARQHEGQYVFGAVAALKSGSLSPGMVGVASSGVVSLLVSNIGGDIKMGDRITISSIEGVGMKAVTSGWMIGIAQRDFATVPREAIHEQVTTSEGEKKTVAVKEVPVLLAVSYYNPGDGKNGSGLTGSVQTMLETAAGHPVSAERALLAMIIFSIAMILLVALVYSAVKNSLVSIGRNPLAQNKIIAGLVRVLATAVGVIIVTLGVIYIIVQ